MNLREEAPVLHHLARVLRALADRLDPAGPPLVVDVHFTEVDRAPLDFDALAWSSLDACHQSARVANRVHDAMVRSGLSNMDVADRMRQGRAPAVAPAVVTAREVSDLLLGQRHLRGETELLALAAALHLDVFELILPARELAGGAS